jgi:hypothetical protein
MKLNGSSLENKSAYELDKLKDRFDGFEGQHQGPSHTRENQWIPKLAGLFAYPVHVGGKHDKTDSEENK